MVVKRATIGLEKSAEVPQRQKSWRSKGYGEATKTLALESRRIGVMSFEGKGTRSRTKEKAKKKKEGENRVPLHHLGEVIVTEEIDGLPWGKVGGT